MLSFSSFVVVSFYVTVLFSSAAPCAEQRVGLTSLALRAASFESDETSRQKLSELGHELEARICRRLLQSGQKFLLTPQGFSHLVAVCTQRSGAKESRNKNESSSRLDATSRVTVFHTTRRINRRLASRVFRLFELVTRATLIFIFSRLRSFLRRPQQADVARESLTLNSHLRSFADRMESMGLPVPANDRAVAARALVLLSTANRETNLFVLERLEAILA